jgi:hypothetical protein
MFTVSAEDLKLRRLVALKVLRGAEDQEGRLLRCTCASGARIALSATPKKRAGR